MSDYYSLERIRVENADYNLIIGERGNGKTYAIQEMMVKQYLSDGSQSMLLRRWVDDVKASNAQNFFIGDILNQISEWSEGKFDTLVYRTGRFIACSYDSKGKLIIDDSNTVCHVWNVSESERLKGQSFPKVRHIVYEEFISLSNQGYINDEVMMFLNVISTVVRDRTDVKIWMLGNTVNPYNPYFNHFGIKGLELKQGEIWTRSDPETGCKVAVEFCAKRRKGSLYGTSAKYYAFGQNTSDMIVDGKWQLPNYPVRTLKRETIEKWCKGSIGIAFDGKQMKLHLLYENGFPFLFVETVEINEKEFRRMDVVLDQEQNIRPNHFTSINNLPQTPKIQTIFKLLQNEKIWYDTRLTGSYFNNFMAQTQ